MVHSHILLMGLLQYLVSDKEVIEIHYQSTDVDIILIIHCGHGTMCTLLCFVYILIRRRYKLNPNWGQ